MAYLMPLLIAIAFSACDVGEDSAGQEAGLRTTTTAEDQPAPPGKAVDPDELRRTKQIPLERVRRQAKPLPTPQGKGRGRPEEPPKGGRADHKGAPPASLSAGAPAGTVFAQTTTQNGPWTGSYSSNPNRQIGKLYFDIQIGLGEDWRHCTGTAVNSENKSLIFTAGHCVYNPDPDQNDYVTGNGYWYEHVQFCPGYESGCRLGVWYARQRSTTNSWFYGSGNPARYDWSDDAAVVLVDTHPTQGRLVNAIGGQGITFNASTSLSRHSFGYPAADFRWPEYSYGGEDMIYCPARDTYDGYGHVRISCTMTGGSSGGPWIISPNSSWFGYLNSVNSHKAWGGASMGGPYFGSAESSLFTYWRSR
jgi:hypothetical protein